LCQIGYTAGARSSPQLGWARNLLSKQAEETASRLMYESSSVFALFWNILRNQLPGEVNHSFEEWLEKTQIVRMDTMGSQDSTEGAYTVKYGEDVYEFHGVDMPPPSGVFGTNYTRFVKVHLFCICLTASFRFIHRETSSHKYAVAWTTMRDQQLGNHGGGHFFISTHGIKVEAATDSVVVWNPKAWHGTSLQQRDPNNPEIFQAGLAIVTPSGVSRLWGEVQEKKISIEEARRKILELESEEVDT
jgi:hypothetical protein